MKLETTIQKSSYAIGLQIGEQVSTSGLLNLDLDALKRGIADSLANNEPILPLEKLHESLREIHHQAMQEKSNRSEKHAQAGKDFLTENSKRSDITTTQSGLQYQVITQGKGNLPTVNNTVRVHYQGELIDGTVFDSSIARGQPAEFAVNGVIRGWVEALQMMPVGSKWRLFIPHELAYGEQGAGNAIPPYSALIFEVELLDIIS